MDHAWLKNELSKPGRSQSALARFLGVEHPSIVNRMCSGDRKITSREADQIRAYLAGTTKAGDATIYDSASRSVDTYPLQIRGTVEAGSWRERALSDLLEAETLIAPREIVDTGAFALRVAGPSMDQFYKDGSYVIVQPWEGGPMPIGKHVVVEREKQDGTIESTVKELVRRADGEYELWPRSTSPLHQTPITFDNDDSIRVRIVGRVIWAMTRVP